jgi:acetoin utilization protein AcuB
MHDHKIGCLPVVDATGQLVGLITDTDLLAAMVEILGYNEQGVRIALEVPDDTPVYEKLVQLLHDHQLDIRSLVTCGIHTRPGFREIVIRVRGQHVDAMAHDLKAKFGQSVTVHPG